MRIERHDSEEDLVMDLYFTNIIESTSEQILEKLKAVDGAGSGLDADLVDGRHADAFVLKNNALSGRIMVVAGDGEIADGGNYDEFVAAFSDSSPGMFR